jgi:hypothetical protein
MSRAKRWIHRLAVDHVSGRAAIAIAVVLGAAMALCAFDLDFLLGRGDFWAYPSGDASTQLLGFRYFLHDSWRFPLLKTTMIAGEHGASIIHLDSLPILALPAKLLAPITGEDLNPFGLWMAACYVLMAYFAVRLTRALGARTAIAAVAAALVALTFHPFLGRFYHIALNAQFLLVWAACLYVEREIDDDPAAFKRAWTRQLIVGLLVHPYLFTMSFAIFVAALLRGSRAPTVHRRVRLRAFAVVLGCILAVGVVTGHLGHDVAVGKAKGFGQASHNVGSLFVPTPGHSQLAPDIPPRLMEMTGFQWDGSMFLGFGVLALVAVHLVASTRQIGQLLRRHAALVAVLVLMYLFALSNRAYVFQQEIWTYKVPRVFGWVAMQFRATGRFAWPVGFWIVTGIVGFTARRFRPALATPLLVIVAAVGVYEAIPSVKIVRAATQRPGVRELDWAAWAPAIAGHDRVAQWPSYQCMDHIVATVGMQSREIQFLSAVHAVPINGTYSGRNTLDCDREHRSWQPLERAPGALSLYVRAEMPAERPPGCRAVGAWIVCSDRWGTPAMAALGALADADAAAPYSRGELIDFGPVKSATPYLESGWGRAEYRAMVVDARSARLVLQLEDPVPDLELHVDGRVVGPEGDPSTTTLAISANGVAIARRQLAVGTYDVTVTVPASAVGAGRLALTFERIGGPPDLQVQLAHATLR